MAAADDEDADVIAKSEAKVQRSLELIAEAEARGLADTTEMRALRESTQTLLMQIAALRRRREH